ncbi:hypothetical protein Nepgr_032129 [Nepenthes gracilis]|uniref:Gnk2-homologous domain-containing protein n=1 Tax=Nepenthes gracilis TaxID=150966 RepID=A0AAD3Y819_NEPGR|nr:hypothetical protein Nepgr_032129 [Nepenthes gracilis]
MAVLSHISKIILITLISFLFLPCNAEVQYVEYYCYDNGNYTKNSTYQENLVQALSDLYSEASVDSFHSTTSGSGDNQVSALYYCRGDLTLPECQSCVKLAALAVFKSCFGQKEAIIWYEFCTLRYANRRIVGEEDVGRGVYWLSQRVVDDGGEFNQTVDAGFTALIHEAVSNSTDYFATGEADVTASDKVYGLVQCSPDITATECENCLKYALNQTNICCIGRIFGILFLPSCQIRYGMSLFYQTAAAPLLSPLVSPSNSSLSPSPDSLPSPDSSPSPSSDSSTGSNSSTSPPLDSPSSPRSSDSSSTAAASPSTLISSIGRFHKNHGGSRQTRPPYGAVVATVMTISAVSLFIGV